MSIPANPKAMHGWFGYRHIPYQRHETPYALTRDIVELKLPKKEFFEITHMVEAIRRHIDPWAPLFDCCSGHGLLGMLLACDPRIPRATVLDLHFPPNQARLLLALSAHQPGLEQRLTFLEANVSTYQGFCPGALVAAHACGLATDAILEAAVRNRARFFIMTCCISREVAEYHGMSRVHGLEPEINARRLQIAAAQGYTVTTLSIDARITPWNTILAGWPQDADAIPRGGLRESPLPARMPPRLVREAADAEGQSGPSDDTAG